jgi:hypothetical protein
MERFPADLVFSSFMVLLHVYSLHKTCSAHSGLRMLESKVMVRRHCNAVEHFAFTAWGDFYFL